MSIKIKQKIEFFLAHALNISTHERPRVIASWAMKFFLQIATVIGATLLTAFFVDYFHVSALPYLYIVQAIVMVFSVFLFSSLLDWIGQKKFITLTAFSGIALFAGLFFVRETHWLFFAMFIFALSVLIAQIFIVLSLFIEELFSPLESERTFPVIESSEPIGTLVAGILILLGLKYFDVYSLLFFASSALAMMICVFLTFLRSKEKALVLKSKQNNQQKLSKIQTFEELFKHARLVPFLRILAFIVFLFFATGSILEFQFVKALDAHASHGAHASALTHSLGSVHVFISLLLIFVQFFFSARIMHKIGLTKTIALNPILSGVSFLFMLLNFSFLSAVGAKAVFETTGAMLKNSHQISLFSLKEKIRPHAKEFIEGIARPLGIICGTLLMILGQLFLQGSKLDTALQISLLAIATAMFFMTFRLSKCYNSLARKNLEMQKNAHEKIEAIEVLAQKGHHDASDILAQELENKNPHEVREKILQTLGILGKIHSLPAILRCFHDKSVEVQLAAVKSLSMFGNLEDDFLASAFAKFHIVKSLKNLFKKTKSKRVKTAIIKAFTSLKNPELIPFLVEILKSKDDDLRAEGAFACRLFHDPTISFYLEKCLQDKIPKVKANAIIALWQFVHLRISLLEKLLLLLDSKSKADILAGVFALGEIRLRSEENRLLKMLKSKDRNIRHQAAIALGKINHDDSVIHLLDFVWHEDKQLALKTKENLHFLHPQIHRKVKSSSMHKAAQKVAHILKEAKTESLENLSKKALKELLHIFRLIDAKKEILQVKTFLEL